MMTAACGIAGTRLVHMYADHMQGTLKRVLGLCSGFETRIAGVQTGLSFVPARQA